MQQSTTLTAESPARGALGPYAVAFVVTVTTLALRELLGDWFDDRRMLILFVLPIIFSAYKGGIGPGLLSTAIAVVGAAYLFLPPRGSFFPIQPVDIAQLVLLVVAGVFVSLLSERLRHLRRQADEHAAERDRLARTMRRNDERLQTVIAETKSGIVIADEEGNVQFCNKAALEMFGFEDAEELSRPMDERAKIMEVSTPDGVAVPLEERPLVRVLRGEHVNNEEMFVHRRNTEVRRFVSVDGKLIHGADGERIAFITITDITERMRTEALLRVRREHAQSLLRLSRNLERATDHDDVLNAALEEIQRTLGLNAVWICLVNEGRVSFMLLRTEGGAAKRTRSAEVMEYSLDGDPTLQQIAEARDIIVIEDVRLNARTNQEFAERTGLRTTVAVPINLMEQKLGTLGTGTFGDEGVRTFNSAECEFLAALACHVAASLDRTRADRERERAEQRLATQAAVSRVLAEASSLSDVTPRIIETLCKSEGWGFGAFWEVDHSAGVLRCSESWGCSDIDVRELSEQTRAAALAPGEGLPGRVWMLGETILIPDVGVHDYCFRSELAAKVGLRSALGFPLRANGSIIGVIDFLGQQLGDADDRLRNMFDGIGQLIGMFMQRKRAVAELRQSEARFASLFRANPSPLFITRVGDERNMEVNDAFIRMTGYSREELVGRTGTELNMISAETHARIVKRMRATGSVRGLEIDVRTKAGEMRRVLLSVERIELDGEPFALAIGMDVTEQRQLESRLRQSQKMDSIGLLAGGIAHDFNNVLTVITGASDILLSTLPPEDPSRELLEEIRTAGGRAASLTGQLLAFSRRQMLEPKALDVNEVVADTEKMLRRLLGEDIHLTTTLGSNLHTIMVDPGNLVQVIMNLAVNARDAMPTGGHLTIETANKELDAHYAAVHADVPPGHYVVLAISDTGVGIPPEVKDRLFEPFFTTKGLGRGTGFGLAVVHGIVAQNGGHVEVYSEEGLGTTFKIYFPASKAAVEPEHASRANMAGHETILVVEDDPGVRDVAVRSLRGHGYTVLEADSGTEALTVLAEHSDSVALVLTDVVMPKMSGRELAEIVHADYPELKVIFTSGYTDDSVVRHGILAAEVAFLQKPYTPNNLAARVRELLDEGKRMKYE